MAKPVFMPKLGMTMEKGTIMQWLKKEGDPVKVGEPILEVMTDKINIEVEAYEEGVLLKTYYGVDEDVEVNRIIGYIGQPGEAVPAHPDEGEAGAPERGAEVEPQAGDIAGDADGEGAREEDGPVRATPAARRIARERGLPLADVPGSGPKGRIQAADVENCKLAAATPLAKKIAAAEGIDLASVAGSGSRGKVMKEDVVRASAAGDDSTASETIKVRGIRAAIARRMSESAFSAPHVTLTTEVDMGAVVELRQQLLPAIEAATGLRVSYTEIIMKATALALTRHPKLNATFNGDTITQYKDAHIGLAVEQEDGLVVPVVTTANRKSLSELTRECKSLAALARDGKLQPRQMTGGTFTVSNLGVYAVDTFTPIINPPEVAILGVGRIRGKPAAFGDSIALRPMMGLSLSFDHRAVDGAPAAAFLTELSNLLQSPYQLLI